MQTPLRGERAALFSLVALCLLSYARLYMLRDVYADDNCWLFGIWIGYDLPRFLDSGFNEMRRELLGVFLYYFFLPYRFLEAPHVLWHSIVVATQIATVLVFYRLAYRLCGDAWLAALAAGALVVLPLDHAAPYLSSFNYRGALLLGLASLYLTDRAAERGRWGADVAAAVLAAALAGYFLSEAALALEPARLLILWYRLPARAALRWLAPFIAVALPLVAYKLLVKPYGMYAGMYETGFAHFFDWRALAHAARLFLLGEWWLLRRVASYAHPLTPMLAAAAALLVFAALMRHGQARRAIGESKNRLAAFAVAVLAAQLGLFFYAGRPPKLGFDSTHAILAQPGYAALVGLAVHRVVRWAAASGRRHAATAAALGVLCGAGIFFNNLRLDMFDAASREESQFWQTFRQRFPELPERADWLIDAQPRPYRKKADSYFEWEDLHATYDLEFALNRFYAKGAPERRHRVYTPQEARDDPAQLARTERIERASHFGRDRLDAAAMTVVYYRDGRLLVNDEILKANPAVAYRRLADKPRPPYARPLE